ncbi:hypothetical protein TTHT_2063 [Thermotomaculum hydrothermale]|uniref:Uncharacterized protein n=1 Tax=Thermotomaculum hydrothermale TaxID=981385 RepID=A0A7R6PNV7_9BACT|nr:hypothetical protein [Thermotomaculum hydrothermale]BBB33502.1 hypothetical protein TTHT_2063 [Thermotomaculum hydrothermale]
MKFMKILAIVLFCSFLGFSLESGVLNGKMPVVKGKAPVHTTKYFVVHGDIVNGKVVVNAPISSKNPIIVLLGEKADSVYMDSVYKLMARGFHTPELENMEVPGMGTRVDGKNLTTGYHTFVFNVKSAKRSAVDVVISEPDSPIALKVVAEPLSVRVGDTVTIKADLGDNVSSIKTMVKAVIKGGEIVYLKDDGEYPDEVKGDGIFTASIIADTDEPFKPEMVKVEAIGVTKDGTPFMRDATASFMVTNPTTFIDGGVVEQGGSIVVPLAAAQGKYRVEIIFGNEDRALAYVRDDVELNGNSKNVVLPRPVEAFAANRAIVRVLNMETLGVEAEEEIFVHQFKDFDEDRFLLKQKRMQKPILPKSKIDAAKKYGDNPSNSEIK